MGSGKELLYVCGAPGCEYKSNKTGLQEHTSKEHRASKELFCKTCWSKFSGINKLLNHSCNTASGDAACGALGCTFKASFEALNSHILSQHDSVDTFVCKLCLFSFDHPIKFMSHVVTKCSLEEKTRSTNGAETQNVRPLRCTVPKCCFVSLNSQDLITHAESSHPCCEKFICRKCNKSYPDVRSLIIHYLGTESCRLGQTNEGGNEERTETITCGMPDCNEELPPCKLVGHIITLHPKANNFVCKKCKLQFIAVNTFTTHAKACQSKKATKLELGFQPLYRCFYCKTMFNDHDEYEFHHNEAHLTKEPTLQLWSIGLNRYTRRANIDPKTVENEFMCACCGAQMANKHSVMKHILVVHRRHCCPRCGLLFRSGGALAQHKKEVHLKFKQAKAIEEQEKNRKLLENAKALAEASRRNGDVVLPPASRAPMFECYLCSLMFSKKSNLQRHALSRHHVYLCHYCEFVSSGPSAIDDLKRHHLAAHKQTISLAHPGVKDVQGRDLTSSLVETKKLDSHHMAPPPHPGAGGSVQGIILTSVENMEAAQQQVSLPPRRGADKNVQKALTPENPSTLASNAECEICHLKFPTSSMALQHIYEAHRGYYVCRHCRFTCETLAFMDSHHKREHGYKALSFVRINNYILKSTTKNAVATQSGAVDSANSVPKAVNVKSVRGPKSLTSSAESAKRKLDHDYAKSSRNTKKKKKTTSEVVSSSGESTESSSENDASEPISEGFSKEQHACGRCRKGFSEKHALYQHMAEQHRLRNFCKYCSYGTIPTQVLFAHIMREHLGLELRYITLQNGIFVELGGTPSPQLAQKILKETKNSNAEAFETETVRSDATEEEEWSKPSESSTESEWTSDKEEESISHRKTRAFGVARPVITDTSSESEQDLQQHEQDEEDNAEHAVVEDTDMKQITSTVTPRVNVKQECQEIQSQSEDEYPVSVADIMKELSGSGCTSEVEADLKYDKQPNAEQVKCEVYDQIAEEPVGLPPDAPAISECCDVSVQVKKDLLQVKIDFNAVKIKQESTDDEAETLSIGTQELDPIEYKSVLVEGKMCIEDSHISRTKKDVEQYHKSKQTNDVEEASQEMSECPLKVFGGYRVPKTVSAFQKLLKNIGDLYKCCEFTCSYSTMFLPNFVDHLRQHEKARLFCIYCGIIVADATELVSHLDRKHSHCTFQCVMCLYRASSKQHIECHSAHAHPNKPADYTTVVIVKDNQAENVVQLESCQPFYCGFQKCKFNTMKTTDFVDHLGAMHTDEPSYPCPLCKDHKRDINDLVSHFHEHGVNNVQCAYCRHCSVTIGGIILHLCYCHPEVLVKFFFRSGDLEKEFMKVLNNSEYVLPHYFIDLVREKSATMCRDLEHIILQQQCPFCKDWCRGFRAFKLHVLAKHKPAVRSSELADTLFRNYGYEDAVLLGRCPFCSFVAENTAELQEHVLDEELVYAPYECHMCMQTYKTEKDLDEHLFDKHVDEQKLVFHNPDSQLLAWVKSNVAMDRKKHGINPFQELFNPALCYKDSKLPSCNSGPQEELAEYAQPEPTIQVSAVYSVQSCESSEDFVTGKYHCATCGLATFSKTNFERHIHTCSKNDVMDDLGFVQVLNLMCSVCHKSFKTKNLLEHHNDIVHRGEGSEKAISVDDARVHKCGIKVLGLEKKSQNPSWRDVVDVGAHCKAMPSEEFSFYGAEFVPVNKKHLFVQTEFVKVPVRSYMKLANFEPFVLVKDMKWSLL